MVLTQKLLTTTGLHPFFLHKASDIQNLRPNGKIGIPLSQNIPRNVFRSKIIHLFKQLVMSLYLAHMV